MVVNTKSGYQDSNGRNYEYGTYVDYSIEDVKYKKVLVPETLGQIGETVELYANKYEPTRLLHLGSRKMLVLKLVFIEGILCIVIEIYLNYRRKKKVKSIERQL